MPQIYITNGAGGFDVTGLISTIQWGGDYRQCARTLDLGLLSSPSDSDIPEMDCAVGSGVCMEDDGVTLFNGHVMSRTKSTSGNIIDLECYDRGFYLKRIQAAKKYTAITPEAAARSLCADYRIQTGFLEPTGIPISRNFPGYSLWDIIRTLYALAAEQTGKAYHIGFEGAALCVRAKNPGESTTVIAGKSNLMDATTTESIENMVNSVMICDSAGTVLQIMENAEDKKLYGLMRQIIKQTKEGVTAKAKQMLKEGGLEQRITVNALGDTRLTSGRCCVVREPYTGLYGLFWIDNDTHSWKNAVYTCKLVLNFRALMDETTVGELMK